jgi:hypothetical protein
VKKDPNQRIEASVALKHPFLQNAEDIWYFWYTR